ncbi:hypothetical protein VZT92_023123 [Zoarces viviparus]|uniref:Uncharacterized protein n=1 Tax=Zoarces viviparus TaxID=48416 RepID=A0AAW1E7P6_ZOAVI
MIKRILSGFPLAFVVVYKGRVGLWTPEESPVTISESPNETQISPRCLIKEALGWIGMLRVIAVACQRPRDFQKKNLDRLKS